MSVGAPGSAMVDPKLFRPSCKRNRNVTAGALVLTIGLALYPHTTAAARGPTPARLTAAFVYSFARFTEWPTALNGTPLIICVLGDVRVASALADLAGGRVVGGRYVTVVGLESLPVPRTCQVLYVSGDDAAHLPQPLDVDVGPGVLTIGQGEQFVRAGGIAGLFLENDKMRFIVNADALERSGLRLSSKLLSLAQIFREAAHVQS